MVDIRCLHFRKASLFPMDGASLSVSLLVAVGRGTTDQQSTKLDEAPLKLQTAQQVARLHNQHTFRISQLIKSSASGACILASPTDAP